MEAHSSSQVPSTRIGLIADIHGDWASFVRAMQIFEREGVTAIVCAGDVVDRGADADRVVAAIQAAGIHCVKGNHEYSVARSQARWRSSDRVGRLAQVGRIISDATLAFIVALPTTLHLAIAETRILLAHGSPWSDVTHVFADSRQGLFDRIGADYGATTDVVILGHTHRPMQVRVGNLWIVNPGSVYGITGRDSHTCATLTLPDCALHVFDLASGKPIAAPTTRR